MPESTGRTNKKSANRAIEKENNKLDTKRKKKRLSVLEVCKEKGIINYHNTINSSCVQSKKYDYSMVTKKGFLF